MVETEDETPIVWILSPPTCTAPKSNATAATPEGRMSASAATMIPAKPYPPDMPSTIRSELPESSIPPASPTIPPLNTRTVKIFRLREIPAYSAVAPEEPATRNSYPHAVLLATKPNKMIPKELSLPPNELVGIAPEVVPPRVKLVQEGSPVILDLSMAHELTIGAFEAQLR